eukprot:GHVR01067633.1.p1 GENE.GHVR01067633.1~~GHVR01067633.1.p1  ORF type:complete len:264 (+),score=8.54 GHVR01067633.1:60-851(+)
MSTDEEMHLSALQKVLPRYSKDVIIEARHASENAEFDKVVHFVRHGVAFHNTMKDIYTSFGVHVCPLAKGEKGDQNNPYCLPGILDPPLTEIGRQQAISLQSKTRHLNVDLILVSPLCRAIKTGLLAFDHLITYEPSNISSQVPIIANENIREQMGIYICDRRRSVMETRKDFPMVDFSHIDMDDQRWTPTREDEFQLVDRAHEFLLWLRDRPEREIAVFSHSAFLLAMFCVALQCEDRHLCAWFNPAELRSVGLVYKERTIN